MNNKKNYSYPTNKLDPAEKEPYEAQANAMKEHYNIQQSAYKKTEAYRESWWRIGLQESLLDYSIPRLQQRLAYSALCNALREGHATVSYR